MKFYAEPHLAVYEMRKKHTFGENSHKQRVFVCQFDENGEFSTNDEKLISKLSAKFKYDEVIISETPITTETTEEIETTDEIKLRHCKKCDFTCETQGQLLKHYREEHSKGGE